jgi:hypothetical protein
VRDIPLWVVLGASITYYGWRVGVTVLCMITVHRIMAQAGYRIDVWALCVATLCVLVATRVWAPRNGKE